MPIIVLKTAIHSTLDICFDLSRSIDLHKISTADTKEEAVAGTISGLINFDETVTWRATHFGIRQELTSKITAFQRPIYFRDEQTKGIFKSIYHEHKFEQSGEIVIMTDIFKFDSPFGLFGKMLNRLVLTNYLRKLLQDRNEVIKEFAESEKWKMLLNRQ